MRALLACSSPAPRVRGLSLAQGGSRSTGPTPARARRLCLETSFTSLQSPLTDNYPHIGRELSVDSAGLPWEYVSLVSATSPYRPTTSSRLAEWSRGLAPLATPETMSEASGSGPPSPLPACHRPMMKRTPKIPGNLSSAADDLKNNLHFAMLSAKGCYLKDRAPSSGSNSALNSEASYENAMPPPPVPTRRDSVLLISREHRICTGACCSDDLSDNSSPHTSSHSSRISHRMRIDFPEEEIDTNGSSLDLFDAKVRSEGSKESAVGQSAAAAEVVVSVRSSPECRGLMAPATDAGAEWRRNKQLDVGDAALPLLRGLSPSPQHPSAAGGGSPQPHHLHASSPFFNAKRKKYVYPITMVGRGESSV